MGGIITMLSRMGQCSSYDDVEAMDTSITNETIAKSDIFWVVLPSNISTGGQFHVTTDTTQKNKSSYAEYLVLVLYCTHITCHEFKGNMQIQLNYSEISPFEQLCEKM